MGVPKRRTSKMRLKQRKSANSRCKNVEFVLCPDCGTSILSHRVCTSCGKYKGKQLVVVKND
jgi:large subunit ribosomal protein L32